jgi:hypothetical protein
MARQRHPSECGSWTAAFLSAKGRGLAKAAVELPHSKGSQTLANSMARQRHPSECGSPAAAFLLRRAGAWRRRQLNCRTPKARKRSQIRWRGSDILRSAAVRLPPFFCEGQGLGEGGSQELPHSKGSQTLANSMARQRHPSECGSPAAAFLLRRAGAWRRRQLNCRTPKARKRSQM